MFILKISKCAEISAKEIARLVKVHKTPQDDVIVVQTDEVLPRGFIISREDRLLENIALDMPEVKKSKNFTEIILKQKEILRREKEINDKKISKSY